jgi:alpha-L-rhamnosidase
MVGFVRFKGSLERDQEIIMSHGEILQDNCFFNENLRSAKQILKYKGDGQKRIYEPKFTFFGFRYVLIKGLNKVNPKDFEGIVIYSDLEKTIKCKTDNDKINKLIKNSFWGQRSNFLDVPTDCPQRDERMGWTADTQVFVNTACFNMDSYLFYKKYMFDLRGDQTMYYLGKIPAYSPSLKDQANEGGAVWADAATIIPWNFYLNYGDKRILNYFYPMMKDYVETLREKDIEQGNTNLILEGFTYGDWLALDNENPESKFGGTDNGFIMSVYYYHSVELLTLVARELGNNKDYKNYNILKNRIYKALLNKYFSKEGKLNLNTQTSFVLCLQYKIYIDKDIIIRQFKERIKNDYYKIKTGFTGTPFILLTLFDNDMDDIAYRILFNENYPGWLYSINLGATTIWERWNSLLENGTISNTKMNSFNHYAYGSVCESIYSRIAGLRNNGPGWKKVIIQPHLNYRMKNIEFFYNSINGKFEINWSWKDDKFDLNVIIPNGVDAEIILPNNEKFNVKGGHFNFTCNLNKKLYSPFSIDTPIIDIINNKKGAKIIKELLPKIYDITINNTTEIDNIRTLNILKGFNYPKKIINECNEMLSAIRP